MHKKENADNFYLLKIKGKIETFCSKKEEYRVKDNDNEILKGISGEFSVAIIEFDEIQSKKKIKKIKVANCIKKDDNTFSFKVIATTESKMKINNFLKSIALDIDDDFGFDSYFTKEYAVEIFREFYFSIAMVKKRKKEDCEKGPTSQVNNGDRKQLDDNAILMYESDKRDRKQYQIDKDRIVHSKANRRLVDKAQIFTSSKGDHYRTRMTHTIEVTQIARSISRRLKLNEDLTEAIALGHDLGHTPFGHQGERTLDYILCGKENFKIIKNIDAMEELKQRFKHNYQALRILTFLEKKYTEYDGLNLSYQVMEGIWKHTKIFSKDHEINFALDDFFKYGSSDFLYPKQEFPSTLEGQVVAIADEIAQRSHDIDDAFKSHKMTHDSFMKYSNIRKAGKLVDLNKKIIEGLEKMEEDGMLFIDKDDMYRAQISSKIINLFIEDVVEQTEKNLEGIKEINNVCGKCFVEFTKEGKMINSLLESIITKQVINSSEVARFDKTTSRIIQKLFKYYYENPLCLDCTTLIRLYKEYLETYDDCINFTNGDLNMVRNEIERITMMDLTSCEEDERNEYLGKRKMLVRCIVDHIAGMTDTFAANEYHRLYGVVISE